ncbi:hypothetical protein COW36_10830 [bacterium (Candidatus Blackallbacteria) CG17_big_fil_post_rev_8_21_14_2_50_48_46]|uniref:Uncharacterized protein n=1 Tax=bacterium (Candidatus Blackallbacteria) CG17_big_fil_post_rev_8_21_14_2_50_48_46 TaxID=2014261 RepID=A0A2M7G4W8_9BACT|nr:MAG: hypothetical protein COW64_20490 [bacterium (Candidatus Blackallbacteria) CG18_big_fil_WC_8_21_14_2_50_49_26]PIW16961.1 MAG: hypothetical protein COW36_10830 [bacterium (Candidatus Blackallbacteria) CG17_big_fil_post_rev_8_21_14_2_50_48_46]PIW50240.1 MAG: hypothetical protein COW20_03345 [bacterium (Candidatus Blackallbacteria) CG13_big_fil_rev_8_21_14_2_50_49_14]
MAPEETENEITQAQSIDVHDLETLKKLWFMLKNTQSQDEIFAVIRLLLDSLPYDWVDKNENWLMISQQIEQFGESELASLFKLANQRCFQLSLKA